MAELLTIKKIRTDVGDHLIDAEYLGGHTFAEIESMVHGVVDTYVIPSSKKGTSGYESIVESAVNPINDVSKVTLDSLVKNKPSDNEKYKVGDIILMEETSDGKKIFDRWISGVSEDGNTITLSILETQVATHHHKITTTSNKALTSIEPTYTSNTVAKAGTTVNNVLTGDTGAYVTNVTYKTEGSDKGGHTLDVSSATSTDDGAVGHSHNIDAHTHSVKFKPSSMVSQTASAYTSLTSANYTPHTHSVVSVAGAFENDSAITYADGNGTTATFVKSVKDATTTTDTGSTSTSTGSNTVGLSTTTQTSSDEVGDIVSTTSSGTHTHTATTTVTTSVVVSATVAASVVTSVSFSKGTLPTVAGSVITSVSLSSSNVDVVGSWSASVVVDEQNPDNGVLIFNCTPTTAIDTATLTYTSASQSKGSLPSINAPRSAQSRTYGTPTFTTTISESGEHQHGFSHVHAIPEHTHSVNSHTHTYYKTVVSETENAYTVLSTKTHTPHKHTNISAAGVSVNDSEPIKYVTGGDTTSVVRNMKTSDQSCTVVSTSLTTDSKYYRLVGDITFPGLDVATKTLTGVSITPAVDTKESAVKSITTTSDSFIYSVTEKTSANIGGE